MKIVKILSQILILCAISLLGNQVAEWINMGIPGSIIGLLLLFLAMERKWLPLERIEIGANFLIAELLLFFIPSAIGVIEFRDVLQKDWSQLLLVIEASIFFVLVFVMIATEFIIRRKERRRHA